MTTTPQQTGAPTQDHGTAHLLARVGARVIDALLLAGLGLALGSVIGFGPGWLAMEAVAVFGYFVLLDATAGTTVGKRVLGLTVIGTDGPIPTVRQAAIREAFTLLGAIPFIGPPLAAIAWVVIVVTVHASPSGQGVHDRLAGGTSVVTAAPATATTST